MNKTTPKKSLDNGLTKEQENKDKNFYKKVLIVLTAGVLFIFGAGEVHWLISLFNYWLACGLLLNFLTYE